MMPASSQLPTQATLSPLNLYGTIAQQRKTENESGAHAAPKVEEVVMFRCPVCDELHEWESDAETCCGATKKARDAGMTCPCCGQLYETHRDAADCCLWKDLDAYTRWQIADAVESGSDWQTELAVFALQGRTCAA